ncbi:MAG: helix-turn-helix domain-containing protein [Candidatus Dormibacteraceae bacterium]
MEEPIPAVRESGYRSSRELGELLAQLRRERGIGQGEAATRLGIDQPAMSRIERGQRSVSAWELYRLADLLSINPDQLLRRQAPSQALLRAGGASDQSLRRGLETFEMLSHQILAIKALEELL